jgi:hyperosmotically inducible periplasmic protein
MKTSAIRQTMWAVLCLAILSLGGCKSKPKDSDLTTNVQSKVGTIDPGISVDTKEGVVTLSGMVSSQEAISEAEQAAQGVEGVKSVQNNLTVKPAAPEETTASTANADASLKSSVESNLTKYGVTGVTVAVNNGEVTLTGDIKRNKLQDAMKAANEAQPTKVNNQMSIK